MSVQPNTLIKVYTDLALDKSYKNTLYFDNIANQNAFFHATKTPIATFQNNSYQRVNKNTIRVNAVADSLYNACYLAFQNSSYGQKWFYAFVEKVEYVSDTCCEITYSIDSIQSYLLQCDIKQAYVVREHSLTDKVGDNLTSEQVDIGNIICSDIESDTFNINTALLFCTSERSNVNPLGKWHDAGEFQGCVCPCNVVEYTLPNDIDKLQGDLHTFVAQKEIQNVQSIIMIPGEFATFGSGVFLSGDISKQRPNDFDGYKPKNNKLLTYPFNYLDVDSLTSIAHYRYEYFENGVKFQKIACVVSPNAQIALVPVGYNGSGTGLYNYNERITLQNFPQMPYTVDGYANWLAQNSTTQYISAISSAVTTGFGIVTGNPVAIVGGAIGLTNTLNSSITAQATPDQVRGLNSGNIDLASRSMGFYFKKMQVTKEYAKQIDDYFTCYGYATHKIKKPNISSRPHWNFVKTQNANIVGACPVENLSEICKAFDSGVTFWKKASEIGNYDLDNSPS